MKLLPRSSHHTDRRCASPFSGRITPLRRCKSFPRNSLEGVHAKIFLIAQEKSKIMFCPRCGKQVDDNAGFCPNCGTLLKPGQPAPRVASESTSTTAKPPAAMIMMLTANYAPGYRT